MMSKRWALCTHVASAPQVKQEFLDGNIADGRPFSQIDAARYADDAIVSSTLFSNFFQTNGSLDCDASFVFLDGPPTIAVRFQNDERVMEQIFRHLPAVEWMNVIADFVDLLVELGHIVKFLLKFCLRNEVIGSWG